MFPKFSPYLILLIFCTLRPLYAHCYPKHVAYEEYKIGKPPKIPLVKEYKFLHRDLIDKRLQINCTMPVAATPTSKEGSPPCTLIGSWTVFNTKISNLELASLKQDFYQLFLNPKS